MQNAADPFDRRKNRGFAGNGDDLDLDQRDGQRREAMRLSLRLWTEGRHEGKLDFHNCSNLSETGMFIENPDPYALHANVQIEFNLPGVHEPVKVTGRVVSCLDEDTAGENIMGNGFEFLDLASSDAALIQAFVQANRLAAH
jgi:Tfp pilus assembly protein PilZ